MIRKTLSKFKQAVVNPKVKKVTPANDADEYLKQLEKKKQVAPNTCIFC